MRKHVIADSDGNGRPASHQQWVIALQNLALQTIRRGDYEQGRVFERAYRKASNEGEPGCSTCNGVDRD